MPFGLIKFAIEAFNSGRRSPDPGSGRAQSPAPWADAGTRSAPKVG